MYEPHFSVKSVDEPRRSRSVNFEGAHPQTQTGKFVLQVAILVIISLFLFKFKLKILKSIHNYKLCNILRKKQIIVD